jgi:hypothetical protein
MERGLNSLYKILILFLTLGSITAFAEDYQSLRLAAEGGFHFQSYSLSGTGYVASVNPASGTFFGLRVNYQKEKDSFYAFQFRNRIGQTTYTGLTGLTPTGVTLRTYFYELITYGKLLEHIENDIIKKIRLGLGYTIHRRSAELTSPNAIFTSQTHHGLTLNAAYEVLANEEWYVDTHLQFYLPWKFNEDASATGFHSSTFGWELGGELNYFLTPKIDVSVGLTFRQDRNGYTGVGARGTTDGSEALTTIAIPANITFKF